MAVDKKYRLPFFLNIGKNAKISLNFAIVFEEYHYGLSTHP